MSVFFAHMCTMCSWHCRVQKTGIKSLGTGLTGRCVLPYVAPGNQIQVLCDRANTLNHRASSQAPNALKVLYATEAFLNKDQKTYGKLHIFFSSWVR